jgi:hypothetical protein
MRLYGLQTGVADRNARRFLIGVPDFHDGAVGRVARARCTELTVEGDRGFESLPLRQLTYNSLRYLICERFRLLLHKVPA